MKNNQKGSVISIAIVVIALAAICIIVYSYSTISKTPAAEEVSQSNQEIATTTPQNIEVEDSEEITANSTTTAYIKAIEGNKITLDYFEFLIGEEAEKAAVAEGSCTQQQVDNFSCFPNGEIFHRNVNPRLRTFDLATNVKIVRTTAFEKDPTGRATITLSELQALLGDSGGMFSFNITINSANEVSHIEEIYRP